MRAVEYWRSRLSPSDAAVYDEMRDALRAHRDTVDLHISSPDNVSTLIQYLLHDHPELYWVSTRIGLTKSTSRPRYGFSPQPLSVSFKGVFSSVYPKGRIPAIDAAIDKIIKGFLHIKQKSEEEQFEHIASYLMENVTYEVNNLTNQNAANALVFHKAQCSGYAAAFKLIADSLDLWCITISGTASDGKNPPRREPHAWNIVRINNVYYHLDPTNCAGANKGGKLIDRAFFARSDDDFAPTHSWDTKTSPLCPTTLASSKASPVIGSKSNAHIGSLYELRMLLREKLEAGNPFEVNFEINISSDFKKQHALVEDCLRHCLSEYHRSGAKINVSSRGGSYHLVYTL